MAERQPAKNHKTQQGFTLLEMGMVLLLFAVLLGFSIPSLPLIFESDLELDSKRVALIIQKTKEEALLRGSDFRILFDQTKGEVVVQQKNRDSYKFETFQNKGNPFIFSEGVRLRHFTNQPASTSKFGFEPIRFEKIFGENYYLNIDSSGFIDLVELELASDTEFVSIKIINILGRISMTKAKAL